MWKEKYKQCAVCTLCIAVTHSGGIPLKMWFRVHANQTNERNSIEWITLWEKANEAIFSHCWVHVDWVKAFRLSTIAQHGARFILIQCWCWCFYCVLKLLYSREWGEDFILVNISKHNLHMYFNPVISIYFSMQCKRHSSCEVSQSRAHFVQLWSCF